MERVTEITEKQIEDLSERLKYVDTDDPKYEKLLARLEGLLKQRNADFQNEMAAVENAERLEFDRWKREREEQEAAEKLEFEREKLEKETEINRKKNRIDAARNVVDVLKTAASIGCTAGLVLIGYKAEYDDRDPISIPSKIWNMIPKIK